MCSRGEHKATSVGPIIAATCWLTEVRNVSKAWLQPSLTSIFKKQEKTETETNSPVVCTTRGIMKSKMSLALQHEQQRTFGQRLSLQGNRTHPQRQARCDQDLPSFSFGAKSKCPKQCLAMPSTQHLTSKVSFRGIPIKYKPKVLNTGSSKHKFANACASFVFFPRQHCWTPLSTNAAAQQHQPPCSTVASMDCQRVAVDPLVDAAAKPTVRIRPRTGPSSHHNFGWHPRLRRSWRTNRGND